MKKILLFLGCFALGAQTLCAVQMSGDVKAKYNLHWQDVYHHWMRTEANIRLDHNMDSAWLTTNIKAYAIDAEQTSLKLDKAFMGYQFFQNSNSMLNLELGKNHLESMFDSKMQYDSHFMGAHVVYTYATANRTRFLVHGGPCILETFNKRYGFVLEGACNPNCDYPIELKYSFTHWDREFEDPYNFCISQFLAKYSIGEDVCYAAFLTNHEASAKGFYVGYTHGQIIQAKDYMVDLNFQYAANNLLPDWDMKGVSRGFQAKGEYALTDAFTLQAKCNWDLKNDSQHIQVGGIYTW